MSDPTFTLDEAKRELARQECANYGHSWDVSETYMGPQAIICTRCGWSGSVEMGELP